MKHILLYLITFSFIFREGFLQTQQEMQGDLENWSKTASGLPSTAGTTASIAFVRRGKIFVGQLKQFIMISNYSRFSKNINYKQRNTNTYTYLLFFGKLVNIYEPIRRKKHLITTLVEENKISRETKKNWFCKSVHCSASLQWTARYFA